jgi:peptidyl-prolyl cis-trans isomerase A (cyclophilin A)
MRFRSTFLSSALALVCAGFVAGQQSSAPAGAQAPELPDAPTATAAALVIPNGPFVVIDTSMGRITCQFYQKQAPVAVANFIGLAQGTKDWTDPRTKKVMHRKPFFDGLTFHRVIPEFMIQGGDPVGDGSGDPGYAFNDEFDPNLNFDRPGRLAMANSGPNTNGSQFFITEAAYDSLDQHYTLFGQCDDSSVSVVKTIARVQRDANDKPVTPVVINKVTIVQENAPLPPLPGQAPPPGTQPKVVNISAGVAVGLLDYHPNPPYPPDAKKAGVSGRVELEALIAVDGAVKDLKVVAGPDLLQQSALDTVRTWRYRPYLLNGQPVEVRTIINVIFTLGGQ